MKKNNFIDRSKALFLTVVLFSGIVLSCQESEKDLVKPKTITDVIMENGQFSILREIVLGTKMADALRTENLTLFAPNDAAFKSANITAASIISLPKDSAASFIDYHILTGVSKSSQLKTGLNIALNKQGLTITRGADSTITVNKAKIITKDVNADNGVIHIVDKLLIVK
jgi:uncharacterized surface protein with fasciclin (FAS1) repeats